MATLQTCSDQITANRQQVLDLLLSGVQRCDPKIHPNAELKLKKRREAKGIVNK